ncbi:MAG TPA: DUF6152 family protein [Gammaproteobacteria bacterium]|jgi:hypothetical protein
MRCSQLIAVALALGATMPARAHHSDAGYDQQRIIGFQGTVTRYLWRNPHVTVYVETGNEAGELVEWGVETGSTPIMTRSRWSRELFSPGDVVTVRAHPDRRHRTHAMMISIESADGSVWIQDESDVPATASADSLAGVWKGIGSTLGAFDGGLEAVPLTPAGAAAKAAYNFQTDSPIADCIPPPAPGSVVGSTVYLNGAELFDDRVVMRSEFFDAERIVYLDGRGHPENGERTNQGHSIGWWEDDVLVVDTTLFADHRSANGVGVPSGASKHLVERFSLSDDGTRMIVDVELDDPEYLAEPFSGRRELLYAPQLQLYRYDCDPALSRRAGFE